MPISSGQCCKDYDRTQKSTTHHSFIARSERGSRRAAPDLVHHSLRKSAMVLKSGLSFESSHITSTLRPASRSSMCGERTRLR